MNKNQSRIIIVEGLADKLHLQKIVQQPLEIVCTHGTFGVEKFENLLEKYDLDYRDVYIFVDEDDAGKKLRKQLRAELPHAIDLLINPEYVEVELAPLGHLAEVLGEYHFEMKVNIFY